MRSTPFSFVRFTSVVVLLTVIGLAVARPGSHAQLSAGLSKVIPTVTIVHPMDDHVVHYRVLAEWEVDDPDGNLDFFEYAVDSLDVWVDTPRTTELISFTTPDPESIFVGGTLRPDDRFTGRHTLYVRAVDDTGGVSEPDSVTFTATNQTPWSIIVGPDPSAEVLWLGEHLDLTLDGEDPDGSEEYTKPVGYFYKVARVDTLEPPIPVAGISDPNVLHDLPGDWVLLDSGGAAPLDLDFDVPGQYVFGVRALDEAGAIEPFLDFGRNAFKAVTLPGGSRPIITLSESVLGTLVFERSKTLYGGELPEGGRVEIGIACDAEAYGGMCQDFRVALDPDDPLNPNWGEWRPLQGGMFPPTVLAPTATVGMHTIMVQTRDESATVTTATLEYDVVEMRFDRKVLWVDDSFDDINPRDSEHDDFWLARFAAHADLDSTDVFELHTFGPGDRGSTNPVVPTLAELGRYELVIWECRGSGFNGNTALINATGIQNRLGGYLRAGGMLWLDGRMTVAATTPNESMTGGDFIYPKEDLGPMDFAWEFLKLRSTKINNDKGLQTRNLFNTAMRVDGHPHHFQSMTIDLDKLNLAQQSFGGFSHVDAVFNPILVGSEDELGGRLDVLYSYGAAGTILDGVASSYHNRPCAIRFEPTKSWAGSGRVLWFGFSLYYIDDAEAQDTFDKALDWFFGKEIPPTPVRLTHFEVERTGEAALIRWGVGAAEDHAGFHVYRSEQAGDEREQMTGTLLSGRDRYEYLDPEVPAGTVDYWLAEISRSGETVWHGPLTLGPRDAGPLGVSLSPAWPNPFSDRTRIAYTLAEDGPVTLTVFDVQGRRVAVLVNETQPAGRYQIPWNARRDDGSTAAAGMYIVRLTAGGEARIQKTILAR